MTVAYPVMRVMPQSLKPVTLVQKVDNRFL